MDKEEARQHALGYACGREDASGTPTHPAMGKTSGDSVPWMDFAEAYAEAWDDFNHEKRWYMTNARSAYDTWNASKGVTIFRDVKDELS
jgi:hypothetical protein